MTDDTELALDPDAFIEMMCVAASQERTFIEFRTTVDEDGNRVLDHAMEVTDYVEELEAEANIDVE